MAKRSILHMLAPGGTISPFDVNMAVDAGYDIAVPYTNVTLDMVGGLVQDAIFSRPPKQFSATGVFIGGYDVNLAANMLESARKAVVPPFEASVFADPNGAYTTSAALVALIRKTLEIRTGSGLEGRSVMIYGGGPVGLCAAVLVAQEGANPTLVRLTQSSKQDAIAEFTKRYSIDLASAKGHTDEDKASSLQAAHVAVCTAKAGVRILTRQLLDRAPELLVAADVNAVPPSGIEGVAAGDNGVEFETAVTKVAAIGALAIGKLKYDVQHGLFERMLDSDQAVYLDFPDAYSLAAQHV